VTLVVHEDFKLPRHGSYPSDMGQVTWVLQFPDTRKDWAPLAEETLQILLGFLRKVYPETAATTLYNYPNKCFTVVGERAFGQLLILYRHDFTWVLAAVNWNDYQKWVEDKPYYAALPDELPRY
jgi:hypothetical protein